MILRTLKTMETVTAHTLPPDGRLIALFFVLACSAGHAGILPGPLVDAEWLDSNIEQVTLLDVRADVNSFRKRSKGGSPVNPCGAGVKGKEIEPVAGHIPGAVLVRWSLLTTQRDVGPEKSDGWLPEGKEFERLMQKSGVNQDAAIVITYKGEKAVETAMATRLYFTLKYFGHKDVAILNGGTAAWMQSGRKVKFGRSKSRRGDFTTGPGLPAMVATFDGVKTSSDAGNRQLLDARPPAAYLGVAHRVAAVDPQWYGHIAGARNVPMGLLSNDVGPAAVLFDKDTLSKTHELLGVDSKAPTTLYCNTGVMASVGWFVMSELLGNSDVRLYDGSMQEWTLMEMPVRAMHGG